VVRKNAEDKHKNQTVKSYLVYDRSPKNEGKKRAGGDVAVVVTAGAAVSRARPSVGRLSVPS